jgi:hypothetical protein
MSEVQAYELELNNLYVMSGGLFSGAEAEIAILDGAVEIDRLKFRGKIGPLSPGYRKLYEGKPGLTAKLASGTCKISFKTAPVSGFKLEV